MECRVPFTLWFDSHSKYCAGRHAWAQALLGSLLMLVETVLNIFLNLKTFKGGDSVAAQAATMMTPLVWEIPNCDDNTKFLVL